MRGSRFVLASVEAVDALAIGVLLPLLPEIVRQYGVGGAGAVALIAVPVLAAVLAGAWLAPLSTRWGRKSVLVATCLVTAEALFLLAWAGDVFMLFMSRIATGVAAGNVAVAEAARRDMAPERRADDAPALSGRALAIGALAGVVLGVLLRRAGTAAVGYVAGAIAVGSLFSVLALVHETVPLSERRGEVRSH